MKAYYHIILVALNSFFSTLNIFPTHGPKNPTPNSIHETEKQNSLAVEVQMQSQQHKHIKNKEVVLDIK